MTPAVTALLCRTSDHTRATADGAGALASALGERWGLVPGRIGEVGDGRRADWREDVRDAGPCLRRAGERVAADLARGYTPVLFSGHCPVCMATLPEVVRHSPQCRVVWIDAHPDFNSPQTTASRFLGGMCLAAACGVWDAGPAGAVPPAQVLVSDGREVEAGERELVRAAGVRILEPAAVAPVVAGHDVFVHLDLDVLDPAYLPGLDFPVPGGLAPADLERLLAAVAGSARLLGLEVTDCTPAAAPGIAGLLDRALGGLLAPGSQP